MNAKNTLRPWVVVPLGVHRYAWRRRKIGATCSPWLHARFGEQLVLSPRSSDRVGGLSVSAQRTQRSSKDVRLPGRDSHKRNSVAGCHRARGRVRCFAFPPYPKFTLPALAFKPCGFQMAPGLHRFVSGHCISYMWTYACRNGQCERDRVNGHCRFNRRFYGSKCRR